MPFVTQKRRDAIDNETGDMLPLAVGDRCYIFYKEMVRKWKENPRWTTAHEIYKELCKEEIPHVDHYELGHIEHGNWEDYTAKQLAWQVFFQWYVVPYEREKEKINGSI